MFYLRAHLKQIYQNQCHSNTLQILCLSIGTPRDEVRISFSFSSSLFNYSKTFFSLNDESLKQSLVGHDDLSDGLRSK